MAITQTYTAEEAEALSHGQDFELIDGELFILPGSGGRASGIAMLIGIEIGIYLKAHPIGKITGEAGGFIISRHPDTLFCPDVGFIRRERLVNGRLPDSFVSIYPDLAVEVHSPSDRIIDDERKIQRYLTAGTSLVWHINPKTNIVTVHRPGQAPRRFTMDDTLSGEDVLPGFELPVRAIFA